MKKVIKDLNKKIINEIYNKISKSFDIKKFDAMIIEIGLGEEDDLNIRIQYLESDEHKLLRIREKRRND